VSDAVSGVIDGAVRQSNDGLLLKRVSVIISWEVGITGQSGETIFFISGKGSVAGKVSGKGNFSGGCLSRQGGVGSRRRRENLELEDVGTISATAVVCRQVFTTLSCFPGEEVSAEIVVVGLVLVVVAVDVELLSSMLVLGVVGTVEIKGVGADDVCVVGSSSWCICMVVCMTVC
jgi:hypothetical protein